MKIALIAPPWINVPPPKYGGVEVVVATLADGLHALGHDVHLFAAPPSSSSATVRHVMDKNSMHLMGERAVVAEHAARVMRMIDDESRPFDVIHDHSGFMVVAMADRLAVPVVHTMHGQLGPAPARFYEHIDTARLVAISHSQLKCAAGTCSRSDPASHGEARQIAANVIGNGLNPSEWPGLEKRKRGHDSFALWIGRLQPMKGAHLAIEAARRARMRLVLAGPVPRASRAYFVNEIEPHIDGDWVKYVGEVGAVGKRKLYSASNALLMPIRWCEPFGLVMIEAGMSGIPVVAFKEGAAPEIVRHGQNGYLVDSVEEMSDSLASYRDIDPLLCRHLTVERFSSDGMIAGYQKEYESAIASVGQTGRGDSV